MCSATNICHSAEKERKNPSFIYSKTLIFLSLNLEMLNNFKNEKLIEMTISHYSDLDIFLVFHVVFL